MYDNMCCTIIKCCSMNEVTLNCQHDGTGLCTLTHIDRQFLFFSGSLKNDYMHLCITYRLANIFYTTMTHNISDLYGRIHRQMPFYCLYTNSAWEYVTW